MGMGGNGNVESHSRTSLLPTSHPIVISYHSVPSAGPSLNIFLLLCVTPYTRGCR